jgi:hypothetical protein
MKTKKYSSDKKMDSSMDGGYMKKGKAETMSSASSMKDMSSKKETFKLTHQNSKSKYC